MNPLPLEVKSTSLVITKKRRGPRKRGNLRKFLLESDKCCLVCGQTALNSLTIDHIVPLSKGGTNDKINFIFLCTRCNKKKSDLNPLEWFSGLKKIHMKEHLNSLIQMAVEFDIRQKRKNKSV